MPEVTYERRGPAGVLTIAPSGRFAQLTTPDYVVNLRMVFKAESVIATPAQIELTREHAQQAEPSTQDWLPALTDFMQNTRLEHFTETPSN